MTPTLRSAIAACALCGAFGALSSLYWLWLVGASSALLLVDELVEGA